MSVAASSAAVPELRPPRGQLVRRLVEDARPQWRLLTALALLTLLATPLALLTPVPLKLTIDVVLGERPLPGVLQQLVPASVERSQGAQLVLVALLVLAIALLTQLQRVGASVVGTAAGERLLLSFRARLFGHAQRLSLGYHDARGTSDTTYRLQSDATSLQYVWIYGVMPLVWAGFMLVGMFVVCARIDRQLALVAIVITPVVFVLMRLYRERLRVRWHEAKELESSSLAVAHDSLAALRIVKAFGQERREHSRFLERGERNLRARVRVAVLQGSFELLIGLVLAAGTAAALYVGVRHVEAGTLTLGSLVLVMGYLALLYEPLNTVAGSIVNLQASIASAERVYAVLDESPDVRDRPNAIPLRRARGTIEFEDVSFGYGPRGRVLEDVTFSVPAGGSLGVVGETGSGKSTILSLLTRFYDVDAGRILLDDVDIRRYRLADLRNQFALVLQEPVLFATTIFENIAYGRPGASAAEVLAAAEAAHVDVFVRRLRRGYATEVGERGMSLSGGERQRIAIARAFLKDAPILLLDEPTSSVDVASEEIIMDAAARLMDGRTTIMIAHRLSTLDVCDATIEVSRGRVTPPELPQLGALPPVRAR